MKGIRAIHLLNTKFLLFFLIFICAVVSVSYLVSQIYTLHIVISLVFRIITWIVIPLVIGMLLNKHTSPIQKYRFFIYLIVLISSGVLLGIYPNPKGVYTLFIFNSISEGQLNVLILPAVAILTIVTIIGGKLICGWACPLGALQEIAYTLYTKNHPALNIKIPFFITNSTRVIFFTTGIFFAIFYSKDIVTYDSPFGIFRPDTLSLTAFVLIILMTLTSPFIYRPWCVFLCPFGLVSWLYEKIAVFRIKINNRECTACSKCVNACPTTTMQVLLQGKQKIFTTECWICGRCIEICAKKAVRYTIKKY